MAVNLASKFEKKTSDLMVAAAKTSSIVNNNWDWDGVNAIKVFTLTDPTINDYTPNGANRYGLPSEVQDTVQTFTLARDRSFSVTIDNLNLQDTMLVRQPGKYLAQVIKNKMVPEIDTYRIAALFAAGATSGTRDDIVADAATTSSNAWSNFTAINADISDKEAPENGRVALMTAQYYNLLLLSGFVLASNAGQAKNESGDLGSVDGVKVVVVPGSRMPSNCDLIITHPSVLTAPEKLRDYTIHKNPPGINGYQIDFRQRYDAFVDANRVNATGFHMTA
jgi:hypothetical protein